MKHIIIIILLIQLLVYLNCKIKRLKFRFMSYYIPYYYNQKLKNNQKGFEIVKIINVNPNDKYIFSGSLYGTHKKYINGALNTAYDINKNFKSWKFICYCHDKLPKNIINKLLEQNAQIIIVSDDLIEPGNSAGAFWRFLPLSENINFISIDVDQKNLKSLGLSNKIINSWLKSDKKHFKIINKRHYWPKDYIQAGRFGKKSSGLIINKNIIMNYPYRNTFGSDELFLYKIIAPKIKDDLMIIKSSSF